MLTIGLWESLAVVLVGFASSFLRIGSTSWRGVVWAEDGPIFLQTAYAQSLPAALLDPYAGYAHVTPRVIAELLTLLPVPWQGVGIVVVCSLVTGALALMAYHVVAAHGRRRYAAVVAALVLAGVPVGPEILDSLANLQWFLLPVGCLVPLWDPAAARGRVASVVVLVALAASCPFGVVAVAVAGLVWLVDRSRRALVLAASGALAAVVQLTVMAAAPAREGLEPTAAALELASGWLRRALADGFLGVARHDGNPSPSVTAGVVLALVVLVLVISLALGAARQRLAPTFAAPVVLLGASALTLALPVVATGTTTGYPLFPGRYYVAPAVLAVIAVAMMAESAWAPSPMRPVTALARLVSVGLGVALVTGLATSWWLPESFGRHEGPRWSEEVDRAVVQCAETGDDHVPVAIAPQGWSVEIPCADLT